ncbi:class I SAM-dependent methyltransferase [Paenibacillus montanisoli]|uniref:Class I SAM-dependent methyltransferase n=1 Tax=Paenibacillus montanisoli TaxID=2081970 RepID=A0A328U0V9_9BACL|nr:class I SAM-dependent methyltransferase [Paenibacillus montanisoli]RAP73624.1 class I SAM-dependent methyltransferase [Paenibacillus montanisoli]
MTHFQKARAQEIDYHATLYRKTLLFEPGTWLAKPVKAVMEQLLEFDEGERLDVLDLGCGIGRNSIPMAQLLKRNAGGTIVCVDLLPIAIQKLEQYAEQYDVRSMLQTAVADVEHLAIERDTYDYIVACSCLEHVSGRDAFAAVVKRMMQGTRPGGINCLQMSTSVIESDVELGAARQGMIELYLDTEEAVRMLRDLYRDWEIRIERWIPQSIVEQKNGRVIEFRGNWLTFAARKGG